MSLTISGSRLPVSTIAGPFEDSPASEATVPAKTWHNPAVAVSSEEGRWGGVGADWIKGAVAVLAIAPVAYAHRETLLAIGSLVQDPVFSTLSLVSTVNAFRSCMDSGFFGMDALMGVACGLSAVSGFDRIATAALGVGVGIGSYGVATGGFVTLVKFGMQVQQGDVPGALLSGTKLVAIVALSGHPVTLGVVIAADFAYSLHRVFRQTASQPEPDTEQQLVAADFAWQTR